MRVPATALLPLPGYDQVLRLLSELRINERHADGSEDLLYTLRDHLGSVDTIVDSNVLDDAVASTLETLAYSPFGERRLDARDTTTLTPITGNRGFTDHEHIDEARLIHMNGRVYDPVIGRFLTADFLIQSPHSSQSYNRYSYVWNNPLRATDPSGYEMVPVDPGTLANQYVDYGSRTGSLVNNMVAGGVGQAAYIDATNGNAVLGECNAPAIIYDPVLEIEKREVTMFNMEMERVATDPDPFLRVLKTFKAYGRIAAGGLQIVAGKGMCATVALCSVGAPLVAQGVGNIGGGASDYLEVLGYKTDFNITQQAYEALSPGNGEKVFFSVDVATGVAGLAAGVRQIPVAIDHGMTITQYTKVSAYRVEGTTAPAIFNDILQTANSANGLNQ